MTESVAIIRNGENPSFTIRFIFSMDKSSFFNLTFDLNLVVLRAKCKNVANKMQKIGFKKRHFKWLLNAK